MSRRCFNRTLIVLIILTIAGLFYVKDRIREKIAGPDVTAVHIFDYEEEPTFIASENPAYYCKKHGKIHEVTYIYANNEEHRFCTLCLLEVLMSHFDEVKEIKETK